VAPGRTRSGVPRSCRRRGRVDRRPACPGAPEPCCRQRLGNFPDTVNAAPVPPTSAPTPPAWLVARLYAWPKAKPLRSPRLQPVVAKYGCAISQVAVRLVSTRKQRLQARHDLRDGTLGHVTRLPSAISRLSATYPNARRRCSLQHAAETPCISVHPPPWIDQHTPCYLARVREDIQYRSSVEYKVRLPDTGNQGDESGER
jgi:hypothetical protein